MYLPLKIDEKKSLRSLSDCLRDVKYWLAKSFLQINNTKTEVIVFGPTDSTKVIVNNLGPLSNNVHSYPNT